MKRGSYARTTNINWDVWSPHRPPQILWVRKSLLGQACLRTVSSGHLAPTCCFQFPSKRPPFLSRQALETTAISRYGDLRGDRLEVAPRGLSPLASPSSPFPLHKPGGVTASLSSSLCKTGACRKAAAVLSPLTLAGTPQWSGVAPAGLADSQRVSQPVKPALVRCLGEARGFCEAELSPAPPGTPQRGLAPKEREEALGSGAEGQSAGGAVTCLPSWRWSGAGLHRGASPSLPTTRAVHS